MNNIDHPLVTVNILTHNRKEELRNTLSKTYSQDYTNIEVIVVDNASTDGTAEMVRNEFPDAVYVKLEKNIGAPGYNSGFKIAKGDYILLLDDDSYPDKNTISEGLKLFRNNSVLGIVAYNIYNNRFSYSETKEFKNHPFSFIGCGALISKKLLNTIGFYNELYFLYYNEFDLSARCYDAGFDILYLESVKVYHNQSPKMRSENGSRSPYMTKSRYYYHSLNYLIFLWQNFNIRYSLLYTHKWLINRILIAVKSTFYGTFIKALFAFILLFPTIIAKRKRMKISTQRFYGYGNVPIFDPHFFK